MNYRHRRQSERQHAPHENRSSCPAPRDGHKPVHCPVPKPGLPISLFLEERGHGRFQGGDDVIVSRFLAAPYRNEGCVQKVQGGEENLPNKIFDVPLPSTKALRRWEEKILSSVLNQKDPQNCSSGWSRLT